MSFLDKFCIVTTLMCLFSMGVLACAVPDGIEQCAGDFVCELQYASNK